MKILVTGGNGYVGREYIKALKEAGFNSPRDIDVYDLPHDILNVAMLEHEISQHDLVVHFAAIADLYDSVKDPDRNFEVNVRGTYNVAKFCQKHNKFLVYISTCCVYGNSISYLHNGYVAELSNLNTRELYASTKLAGEYIVKGMPNLNWSIWRIGTNYGPGMRESLFTYIAMDKVNKGETIQIHGDGTQTRNYICIKDLCDGMIEITKDICLFKVDAMGKSNANKGIFNICGNQQISVLDCIEVAEKLYNKKAIVENVVDRIGQIQNENISIAKMNLCYKWGPKICFYEGMEYTMKNDERLKKI